MADLVARYRALPPRARVRLAKRTSNLFRFGDTARTGQDAGTLDPGGLTGVLAVMLLGGVLASPSTTVEDELGDRRKPADTLSE